MRQFHAAHDVERTTAVAVEVRERFRGSRDAYIRARVRNVAPVAIVMPRALRAIGMAERHPRVVAAGTSAIVLATGLAARRARRR